MLREMWRLLTNFLRDFTRALVQGTRQHWKGILIFCVIAFVGLVGLAFLGLKATASEKFCGMCHNMDTYIESWKNSTHSEVFCTECHFEPGFAGELMGKWKAQLHVVMKITGTAPPRPHTQISDASCLREDEGCHSTENLAETDIVFKGVSFSHDTHLSELRRGKKLKCVSCHSQIVQGEHLTVTETTCFTCHFYEKAERPELGDCQLCHAQTKAKIYIGADENLPFVHKDYLERGVQCKQCHFDVVFGDGHLKDNICLQCHAEPKILRSEFTSEEIHFNHVTAHKVECFRCHAVIDHGILRPKGPGYDQDEASRAQVLMGFHYEENCAKCHTMEQHSASRLMLAGTGAVDIPNMPTGMYLAHLDCGSCHVYITESAAGLKAIPRLSYSEIIQSCSDCHGTGYDEMAKHWKRLLTEELDKAERSVMGARERLEKARGTDEGMEAAKILEIAEENLTFVRTSEGLHNIDYALTILADCQERGEKAKAMLTPGYEMAMVSAPTGCTQLCHDCVECIETETVPFGNVQFPHDVHVQEEGLGCLECHSSRDQHGQTILANCNECHHGTGLGAVECEDCHVENYNLYHGRNACDEASCDVRGEANVMEDAVACDECHVEVAEGDESTLAGIKQTCVDCHDESYAGMVDEWKDEVAALNVDELYGELQETQRMILNAIKNGQYTYDAQDLVNNAEKNLVNIVKGNPVHNPAFSKELADRVADLLERARQILTTHSTVRTLSEEQYL